LPQIEPFKAGKRHGMALRLKNRGFISLFAAS
jgi:hypothetical protein